MNGPGAATCATPSAGPIDLRALRNTLGCFATGVAIITGRTEDGGRVGMTVNSFSSVSLDPPLVLFSIGRSSLAIQQWLGVSHFGVSLLAEDQCDISNRFAKAGGDKWSGTPLRPGDAIDVPLIAGALAWFECALHAHLDGGDHVIVVGRVLSARAAREGRAPALLFYRGRYAGLRLEGSGATQCEAPALLGWQ